MRNDKIKKLRKEGKTYKEISFLFNLTPERVRQIVADNCTRRCKIHNVCISNGYCLSCKRESDFKIALEQSGKDIYEQIKRLSIKNRSRSFVIQRSILIKKLKDQGMSFVQIGKLLKRDHSSIMYLYYKNYEL